MDDLRRALAANTRLRLLVAHGQTDLATPYMSSRFAIEHMPERLTKDRVTLKLYLGGHMMYLRPGSRAELARDAAAMYGKGP